MPIDLSAVNWVFVSLMGVLAFVAALLGSLIAFRNRFAGAIIAGVLFAVALGSGIFATFSLAIACIVKSRERFMGIGQLMTMPLFFASSALYPV